MSGVGFCRMLLCGRLFALCATLWLSGITSAQALPQGEWVTTGPPIARSPSADASDVSPLIVLADGTLLLFGLEAGGRVQQYHPETGGWTANGALSQQRTGGSVTVLAVAVVLVAGGSGVDGKVQGTAELYLPATGISTPTGSMRFARAQHQATLLASGKVLVSGGVGVTNQLVAPAEVYDPQTGTWSFTGVMNQPRASHAAVRMANGKVLVAGGSEISGSLASAEIYDPVTEIWTFVSPTDRPLYAATGVMLRDGRIFVVGSRQGDGFAVGQLYDASTNTWTPGLAISSSTVASFQLVLLVDGSPLVATGTCGNTDGCALFRSAVFDVQSERWGPLLPLSGVILSSGPTMGLLPDGRALIATSGGRVRFGISPPSAQLFRPDNATPRLVVSPSSVVLQTEPGIPVRQSVNVQNTGGATLTGSVTALAPFTVISGSPFTLAPGTTAPVVVQFTSPGFGTFSSVVQFMSNGNWVAVPVTGGAGVQISGRVTGIGGAGVDGVTINLTGAATGSTATDVTGNYHLFVPPNNGYNLTPTGSRLTFTPSARSVIVGTQSISGMNFTATIAPEHLGVFRSGSWFLDLNGSPPWDGCGIDACFGFGLPGDKPVVGDWTGTGKAKIAVFRDGGWSLDLNGNGRWDGCSVDGCLPFGLPGDEPVAGDWTGIGRESIGVVRDGFWWFLDLNGNGQWDGCAVDACLAFGLPGDLPITGDWTGTGHAKIGVFRDGYWFLDLNGNGQWDGCAVDACLTFGIVGDLPVVGDWTGTGHTNIGVFRNGNWFLDLNGNGQWDGCNVDACIGFGLPGDRGVVGRW